ncbi:MAG: CPBP family intramembrane metalloprotease [Methanosarcinaceae archaeon]|nr:CPBP family intramembrane metalloprotease [Methanosarcinaceae archaeon]NKQ38619.1 CPBP family intramembrane metalloprotease [Methanosarcinales archaeon]
MEKNNLIHYKVVVAHVLAIFMGEFFIFYGQMLAGATIHFINMHTIVISMVFIKNKNSVLTNQLIQSLVLLLQLRLISMIMPIFFAMTIYHHAMIYAPLFIPIYILLVHQKFTMNEIGATFKSFHIYVMAAIPIGMGLAWIGYHVIHPAYMIPDIRVPNLIIMAIIMIMFAGMAESLIFWSILQTRFEKVIGPLQGVLATSVLFGIMHSGHGNIYVIAFACFVGLIMGYIFHKTRSLPFIVSIFCINNIFLYGLFPHML